MPKKLFVGNLAFSSTEESIRTLFSQHGEISLTGRPETADPQGHRRCLVVLGENLSHVVRPICLESFDEPNRVGHLGAVFISNGGIECTLVPLVCAKDGVQ